LMARSRVAVRTATVLFFGGAGFFVVFDAVVLREVVFKVIVTWLNMG